MNLDEDGLLSKLIVRALNVQDWHCCCYLSSSFVVGILEKSAWKDGKVWNMGLRMEMLIK
jgi:hypothetical protein